MTTAFAPVSRPTQLPAALAGSQAGAARTSSASGNTPARLAVVDPVAEPASSVSLSQQALAARVSDLGARTVDAAQKFLGNFANTLFGDAAKGASVRFDSVSLSADASLALAVAQSADGGASSTAAALNFSESAHFIGKGQITTADGQTYNFELEVKYEANLQASSAQTEANLPPPDMSTLVGKQLPPIQFPGSLADLFKVLGRELKGLAESGKPDGAGGNLSLRLLRLVNTAALLAPRQAADQPPATGAERSKALASYAPSPVSTEVASA